jgi:biotin operon repressor
VLVSTVFLPRFDCYLYEKLKAEGTDVVYPAGDGYNVPVIQQIKKDGLYYYIARQLMYRLYLRFAPCLSAPCFCRDSIVRRHSNEALHLYEKLKAEGTDVVYPAGDGYNVPVIQQTLERTFIILLGN